MRSLFRLGRGPVVVHITPPFLLAIIYAVLIMLGAAALKLPFAHHQALSWADALFTSVSAVTVTGLAVVDTGSHFTGFGQAIIAVLIQLGGLGLMTFAVLLLAALGIPVGMPHRIVLQEDLNQVSLHDLTVLVVRIFRISMWCELAGAAVLATVFVPEFGWGEGLWHAVFHSVSAFNNAGFALFPDSLSRWAGHPVINIAIPALFIIGGLGFVVLGEIHAKRRWRTLSLHSKLMLTGTLVLIGWSWLAFLALEWTNPGTLGGLGTVAAKVQAAWFQAVTPRTAGFNTVDIAHIHDSTALLTMTLMLVGGGSTSTAGGIKVTTLIVLLLATVAFFRRRETLHAFGRSLGPDEVMKVMALTTLSVLILFTAIFIISMSHDGAFLPLAFEAVSAFGTTGLSMGATGELDALGRSVIMALMFTGRIGPLTFGFFLARRGQPRVRYARGRVYLG